VDVERALVSSAIAKSDGILELVTREIGPESFSGTPSGQQCAEVLRFCIDYTRAYQQQPPLGTIQRRFPTWVPEYDPSTLEALVDEFLEAVGKRFYDAAVLELSTVTQNRENWSRLPEIMLDKARELAAHVPSGRVSYFAAEAEQRYLEYEQEKGIHRPGVPMGIPVIDMITTGIKPGWLVTFAGASGLGKSFLSTHALLSAFEADERVLMLSLEMSRAEVLERLQTMVMNWRHTEFMTRQLSQTQIDNWRDVAHVYSKAHGEIIVRDKLGGCTLDRVYAEIERHKPKVCVIDYVQRMRASQGSHRPKWEQLEDITNELKSIATDTDTGIIMVSQDGRDAFEQGSTRTNMAGSISVYQAADVYIGMQQSDDMRALGKMRVKMLKFRHGPLGETDMLWDPERGQFDPWDDTKHGFSKMVMPAVPT
jgi:replicative DNA helicase